jgi:hypothetical protein
MELLSGGGGGTNGKREECASSHQMATHPAPVNVAESPL